MSSQTEQNIRTSGRRPPAWERFDGAACPTGHRRASMHEHPTPEAKELGSPSRGCGRLLMPRLQPQRRHRRCWPTTAGTAAPSLGAWREWGASAKAASPEHVVGAQVVHNCRPPCRQTCRREGLMGARTAPFTDTCAPPGARCLLRHEAPKSQHLRWSCEPGAAMPLSGGNRCRRHLRPCPGGRISLRVAFPIGPGSACRFRRRWLV